jgi:alpha-D-xyloside xylohydrolase
MNISVGVGVRLQARQKPPVIDRTTEGKKWSAMPRSDSIEVLVPAEGVEIFVFGGPTPMDAIRQCFQDRS